MLMTPHGNELQSIQMRPIGWVRGGRLEATKDHWGGVRARVELDSTRFTSEAVAGLDEVSHIEVIFYFHLHADEPVELGARHPRDRTDWPRVGIFAQHGRMRPNRIGASICRLESLDGTTLHVLDLDAVDGSPVLDIKPVWAEYLPRGEFRQPAWVRELMASYW
jgi:tRNA (adenine37-N6)-methyltransferase